MSPSPSAAATPSMPAAFPADASGRDAMDHAAERHPGRVAGLLRAGYAPAGDRATDQVARLICGGHGAAAAAVASAWMACGDGRAWQDPLAFVSDRLDTALQATGHDAASDAALAAVLSVPGMTTPGGSTVARIVLSVGRADGPDASRAIPAAIRHGAFPCPATMAGCRASVVRGFRRSAADGIAAMVGHLACPDDLPHPGPPGPHAAAWAVARATADPHHPWSMALLAWAGTAP